MSDVAVWHNRSTINQQKISIPNRVLPTPHTNTQEVNRTTAWVTLNLVATSLWLVQYFQRRCCVSPQENKIIRLVKPAEKAQMKDCTTTEKRCLTKVFMEPLLFSGTRWEPQLPKTEYSPSLVGSSVHLVLPTGVSASNPPWNYTVAAPVELNKETFGCKWRREPPHGNTLWMGPFSDLSPERFSWFLHNYQSKLHFAFVFIISSHWVDGWWRHSDL